MDYDISIRTGDILLFSGIVKTAISIQLGTLSRYNHIAIAVWLKLSEVYDLLEVNHGGIKQFSFADNSNDSVLFIFESSSDPSYDVLTKKEKFGCRLVRLSDMIRYYDTIAVRRVNITRDDSFYTKLKDFIFSYEDIDYDLSLNLIFAPLGMTVLKKDGSVFCSELVAEYFYQLGIIPETQREKYPSRYFVPKDFLGTNPKIPIGTFSGDEEIAYNWQYGWMYKIIVPSLLILGIFIFWLFRKDVE